MNSQEVWQVEVQGSVYETNLTEIIEWIGEGSVLPDDKVRRGNLRWLKAGKIPELGSYFNGKSFETKSPVKTTLTDANLPENLRSKVSENNAPDVMPIENFVSEASQSVQTTGKFGFADFAGALIYPFKFKTSFVFGAAMFVFLMLAQTVSAFGISMYFAAVVCLMLANALVFGSLANTLENFSRGKIDADFMPRFDDFAVWDTVIHPFLLGLGVYLISFGLLFALLGGAVWYASSSESKIETDKQKILTTVFPAAQNALKAAEQTSLENQLSERPNLANERQNENAPDENDVARLQQDSLKRTTELKQLEEEIKQSLQTQRQPEIEDNSDAAKGIFNQTVGSVLRLSLVFSVPIFLALLWGIFYFPAACAIAGYTGSFAAILNPSVGFDTIKRLGVDYYKIVGVFVVLAASAFGLNVILQFLFSSVSLPLLGNLPAKAVDSLFVFYLSIVFSVTLGIALFKASSRLNLYRG